MATKAYNYDPTRIKENGVDRMRFELGDTMVEGEHTTSALTDDEIQAAIDCYPKKWKRAKLMCLESICHRFMYEPDTRTGPLELELAQRAKLWQDEYKRLKDELDKQGGVPTGEGGGNDKAPYFHTDMMQNMERC